MPPDVALSPAPADDIEHYRADFPILSHIIHGRRLAYLDNAASTQKPRCALDAMTRFQERDYSNIHRGVHELSVRATQAYEQARACVRRFLNAERDDEIVFVRGGTEAINLVAHSWGRVNLKAGDEIVLTVLEHHSNIVPWQMLRADTGVVLRVVPVSERGEVRIEDVRAVLSPRTKLVAIAHVSNVLGTVLPIGEIVRAAHAHGALALIDGCQAVARIPVDVREIDADFYVFSGHKIYGPTGIGVLYGKHDLLAAMPPYQGGGGMIESVTFEETTYAPPPGRFEAGTPAITEAVGLAAALDYVSGIGLSRIGAHEDTLLKHAEDALRRIEGVTIVGQAPQKAGVLSFVMKQAHPHDIGTILDRHGVAIRAGHHCAQPLMESLDLTATARASFGLYNNIEDVEALSEAVREVKRFLG
ncbi:MAG: cysteine desulfurase [Bdellovibrionales bacterium]